MPKRKKVTALNMKKSKHLKPLLILLLAAAIVLTPSLTAFPSFAETGEGAVRHASDLEEYIDATDAADEAVISIDRDDEGEALAEELESQGLYTVTEEDCESIEAFSIYGTRRILVKAELNTLEGAADGVCYDGSTLLSYETVAETKAAYETLCEKYGAENVILDLPVFAAGSVSAPVGWGVDYMNLDDKMRYEIRTSGQNLGKVKVAVIDSGARDTHEIFAGKTISADSKSFMGSTDTIADENGHGTEVAGILAESTPDNVGLMILKVYGASGDAISLINVSQATQYAAENGADIINLSMATTLDMPLDQYSEAVQASFAELDLQLKNASEKGIIICAAAGNVGKDMDSVYSYPAVSEYTLAVGSIDKSGGRSYFSNYGDRLDFCAPGQDVVTASKEGDTLYNALNQDSGTSLASPYIAACCAYLKMHDPAVGNDGAKEALKKSAVDYGDAGWDPYYGWGMPKYNDFDEAAYDAAIRARQAEERAKKITSVTVNARTVSSKTINSAISKAGGKTKYVTQVVLGSKVTKISKNAFRGTKVKTLQVKTKKLTKKSVKNSLKGSAVKTVKIKVSKKSSINKKYVKKYKKYFTKKNAGRRVSVKK